MKMRKLVTIEKIKEIHPIEKADAIECAVVKDWYVVIKKGEFKVGDLCIYFEIDSLLPYTEWSKFLFKDKKEKYRLKTVKLRGQISQGLVMPLSILEETPEFEVLGKNFFEEGEEVAELLGVEKYEPAVPAQLQGICKATFPSWIPKTDEERIQNCGWILEKYKEKLFYATEKIDGSSMTVYLKEGEFGVCSRNLDLLESEGNTLWKVARNLKLEEKLRSIGKNVAIQGELYGEGIQGNKYKIKGQTLACFSIYDIDKGKYLNFKDFKLFCESYQIPMVPVWYEVNLFFNNVDEIVDESKIKSKLNFEIYLEGLVWRPVEEIFDSKLGRLSFKVINPLFLLEYGE